MQNTQSFVFYIRNTCQLQAFIISRCYHAVTAVLQAGTRKRGRPRRRWTDDIKDWTELPVAECMRTAQDRTAWRAKVSLALAFDPQE